MAQEQTPTGVIHGSYAVDFMGTSQRQRATKSDSKPTQKIEISDFTGEQRGKLSNEIDALDSRTIEYFQIKTQAEQEEYRINVGMQSRFFTEYGGNLENFWEGEQETLLNASLNLIENQNRARAFHQMAEKEMADYKESDLGKMDPGTLLYDPLGGAYRADDILKGNNLDYALKRDKGMVLGYLGITDPEAMNLEGEVLRQYIDENKNPGRMTKEARVQLQNILPIGTGWDDVMADDIPGYYEAMESLAKMHGVTKIGEDGKTYVETMDEAQIRALMQDFHRNYVPGKASLNRSRTIMTNRLADLRLASIGANDVDGLNDTFMQLSEIKDHLGNVDNFDDFLFSDSKEKMIGAIKDDDSIPAQKKAKWLATLSDPNRVGIENALLLNDSKEKIITETSRGQIFINEQMEHEIMALTSYYKIPRGTNKKGYAEQKRIEEAAGKNYNSFAKISGHRSVKEGSSVDISEGVLNGDKVAKVLMNDPRVNNAAEYVKANKNDLNGEKFFSDPGYTKRVNPYLIDQTKGAFIDRFIKDANQGKVKGYSKLGKAEGVAFSGRDVGLSTYASENVPNTGFWDKKINQAMTQQIGPSVTNLNAPEQIQDVVKYNAGVKGTINGQKGAEIDNAQLMASPEFREWAKTLSAEEQKKLWGIDEYMNGVVDMGKNDDVIQIMIDRENAGGTKNIERRDISSMNKYSNNVNKGWEARGDVLYYNPVTKRQEPIPTSFAVISERSVGQGWGAEIAGPDDIFVETMIMVGKDQLEEFTYQDKEGVTHTYKDIYGDEKYSIMAQALSGNPEVNEYLGRLGIKAGQLALGDSPNLKKFEEQYLIPIWMVRSNKDLTMGWAENKNIAEIEMAPKNTVVDGTLKDVMTIAK